MFKCKKRFILLAAVVFVLVLGTTVFALSDNTNTKKDTVNDDNTEVDSKIFKDFYDQCLDKAKTTEQIDVLNKLKEDHSLGWGEWKRDALMIIGELPENQARLTLKDAEDIVKDLRSKEIKSSQDFEASFINECNKIAGAPDWTGGSGITSTVYFLDDDHTEAIVIGLGGVTHRFKDENGENKIVHIE